MDVLTPPRRPRLALASLYAGVFLPPLDYFIVNLALPAMQAGLHSSQAQLQLTISAYALAYAVTLITGGRLGDLFGRRRLFLLGMSAFVVASALCGLAETPSLLIAGRVLQGASAALLTPQVLASIRASFPPAEQVRLMGIYGFVFGLASVIGQIGGGALIEWSIWGLGWRAVFLLNIPIGLSALAGSWLFLPESRTASGRRVDLPGMLALTAALSLLIVPVTMGREMHWPPWTLWCLVSSLPAFALFIQVERGTARRGREPLVDLAVLSRGPVATGLVLAFLFYSIAAFFLTYGIDLQDGLGWTPLRAGLALAPYGAGYVLGPLATPWLARRIGHALLPVGFGMLVMGFAVCARRLGPDGPDLVFNLGLVLAGTGQGLVLPSLQRIVLARVEPRHAGMTAGAIVATLYIGAACATTVIGGAFFTALGAADLANRAVRYAHAMRVGLDLMVAPLVAGLLISLWALAKHGRRGGV